MRVLVADDDIAVRRLVVHLLQKIGTGEVVQAADGIEALDHWNREPFDLIVIDWEMPGQSGLDVVRTIRTQGSRVPIFMVSVRAQRSQVIEAIDAGASDYLPKPVDVDALGDKLKRFCAHVDALKLLKQRTGQSTRVEYLNPFITSIIHMFDTMLHVNIVRQTPFIGVNALPENEVSGIIGLTGKAQGAAVVSLGRETAIRCTERLLGERPATVNAEVRDAVGEMANIVAGGAKAQMQQLELRVSLPSVIIGRNHLIDFPRGLTPVCVPFECDWGPVTLQVGLREEDEEFATAGCDAGRIVV
jgi:chemotaxis protein CheX